MSTTRYTLIELSGNKFAIKRKRTEIIENNEKVSGEEAKGIWRLLDNYKIKAPSPFIELIRNDAKIAHLYYDIFNEMRSKKVLTEKSFNLLINAKINLDDAAEYIINFGLKNKLTDYHFILIIAQLKQAEINSERREAFHASLNNVLAIPPKAKADERPTKRQRPLLRTHVTSHPF